MDPVRAQNPASYILTTVKRNGDDGTRIPIAAAVYNDVYRTVGLQLATPVARNATLRLTVVGTSPSGLTDKAGNFLNGEPRLPRQSTGSNFVATFVNGAQVRT